MAYDAARQRVVLFGGIGSTGYLGDTWEWDGTTWAQKFPANTPSAKLIYSMTYDPILGEVLMFGGFSGSAYLDQT